MEKTFPDAHEAPSNRWIRAWLPVAVYMAGIFYLSSLSHPDEELPNFLFEKLGDKLLHGVEYAVLAGLCYRAFRLAAARYAAGQALILAIAAASVYGASDEIHQAFVPFRTATWLDWAADTGGAVIGAVGCQRLLERRRSTSSRDKRFI